MKREILFRGKRICENKNWVEGCLLNLDADSGHVFIVPFFHGASTLPICRIVEYTYAYVNPETVGQFTGLTDKNGKKIFEGDIIRAKIEDGNHSGFTWPNMQVDFQQGSFCLNDRNGYVFCVLGAFAQSVTFEVIGNIYDNPELLEGGVE